MLVPEVKKKNRNRPPISPPLMPPLYSLAFPSHPLNLQWQIDGKKGWERSWEKDFRYTQDILLKLERK